jgi:hypothetical protein
VRTAISRRALPAAPHCFSSVPRSARTARASTVPRSCAISSGDQYRGVWKLRGVRVVGREILSHKGPGEQYRVLREGEDTMHHEFHGRPGGRHQVQRGGRSSVHRPTPGPRGAWGDKGQQQEPRQAAAAIAAVAAAGAAAVTAAGRTHVCGSALIQGAS